MDNPVIRFLSVVRGQHRPDYPVKTGVARIEAKYNNYRLITSFCLIIFEIRFQNLVS